VRLVLDRDPFDLIKRNLVAGAVILMRLSAMTPSPTQRFIPASPL
jgi:hypothetical protein